MKALQQYLLSCGSVARTLAKVQQLLHVGTKFKALALEQTHGSLLEKHTVSIFVGANQALCHKNCNLKNPTLFELEVTPKCSINYAHTILVQLHDS